MKNPSCPVWMVCFLALLQPLPALTQTPAPDRVRRLEILADVWGRLYLFHPRVASEGIDWGRSLREAIPKVEQANNTEELIAALNNSLFPILDSPFTVAQPSSVGLAKSAGKLRLYVTSGALVSASVDETAPARPLLSVRKIGETITLLDAGEPAGYVLGDFGERVRTAVRAVGTGDTLVVDMRLREPAPGNFDWLRLFMSKPEMSGGSVERTHRSWCETAYCGAYSQYWTLRPGRRYEPLGPEPAFKGKLVFLVNQTSYAIAAELLDILQASQNAKVIFQRTGLIVPNYEQTLQFPEGIEVNLGTKMVLSKTGRLGVSPDHVIDRHLDDSDVVRTVGQIPTYAVPAGKSFSPAMVFAPEFPVDDAFSGPSRLQGWFKIWTAVSFFYPQLHNASVDWNRELRRVIPLVEAARSAGEYYTVLRRVTAPLNDSHVIWSGSLILPKTVLPAIVRRVETKPVITTVYPYPDGSAPPIQRGDVIVAINGRSVEALAEENSALTSSSTPAARDRQVMSMLGWLGSASEVQLTVDRDGGPRTLTVKSYVLPIAEPNPVWFERRDSICVIRVDLITKARMHEALREAQSCAGLVFDARGVPQMNPWDITAHLLAKPAPFPRRHAPVSSGPDQSYTMWTDTSGLIAPHSTLRYGGPLVVLIDDRLQSSLENMVFPLRMEARARFVGSRTAGSTGDMAAVRLPGGVTMFFTGTKPVFPDGSPFQNVGIIPDVPAVPTIAGVRTGRDEVLDAGIQELRRILAHAGNPGK